MLHESYKRNIRELRKINPNIKVIDVTPTSNSPLSPSPELMSAHRNGNITWEVFTEKFRNEMNTPTIEGMLLDIANQAAKAEVYLICYEARGNCHRFILLDLVEEIAVKNKIPLEIERKQKIVQGD